MHGACRLRNGSRYPFQPLATTEGSKSERVSGLSG